MQNPDKPRAKRALIVAVQLDNVSDVEFESSIDELGELAKTLGMDVVGQVTQKRSSFDSTAYVGVGKREEIRQVLQADQAAIDALAYSNPSEEKEAVEYILVDHEISPSQALNLENELGCEVMDRTVVILEIFHRNARSHAAQVQVEIARLSYMAPRLREAAKREGPLGRQRSGTGGRGKGQSRSQLDARKVRDRIAELQKEIDTMEAGRDIQRSRRQEQTGLAQVALVGYTNAGKSTLMRALTRSEVLVANQLFATLDTKVRTLYPDSVPRVLVSDTVGFIKNLPHGLVASFKSTLDEALNATLLLHVIDASDPGFEMQLEVTDKVLAEIGADTVPRIKVFNKIDYLGDVIAQEERVAELQSKYPGCIILSARNPDDIARLHESIVKASQQGQIETEIFLPWSAQDLRGEIFASCEVLEERADTEGAFFRFRATPMIVAKLNEIADKAR
ncbi:GTPase HflX [Alkalimarinus alittae]|uniref:GTPase HflX n=1 Tax=Alkalimarinus alittae TaxID=2961619 RepID=A0ABY6MXI7_9ALTE|nr:GTPase HflX [Alkalimarinus alittae]UZE94539.1 GTPase HflX [Alkalimarinus alittae]